MTNQPPDLIKTALAADRTQLTEAEGKVLLKANGIDVPPHGVASGVEDAVHVAERIGYPVVVKVLSPAVQHKSEWADGAGVTVGLENAESVRNAAERVLDAAASVEIDAEILVERAANTGVGTEVIIGGLRDPSFGPVVLAGLGGVFTEVFEDTSHRLAPFSTAEAERAISGLRSAQLLDGYRGRPAADTDALATCLRTVGDLLVDREEIEEIDLNPVLAGPSDALALDALIVLTDDEHTGSKQTS